jgi:hypothetical protein
MVRPCRPLFCLLPRIVTNYLLSRVGDLLAYDDVTNEAITMQITVGRDQVTGPCRVD